MQKYKSQIPPKGKGKGKKAPVMTVQIEKSRANTFRISASGQINFILTTWQLLSSKAHTCTVVGYWSKTANTGNRHVPRWHGKQRAQRPPHGVCKALSTYTDTGLCLAQGLTEGEGVTNINLRPGSQRTQTNFSHMDISVSLGCLNQLWPKVVKPAHSCSAHPQPDVSHCDFMQACLGLTRSLFFYNAGNKETSHQLLEVQQIWAAWL